MDATQIFSGIVSFCFGIFLFIVAFPFDNRSIPSILCGIGAIVVSIWILKDREEKIEQIKKIKVKGGRK
jgi:uncharacterized membrane protein HdeD (DUF308 family)